MNPADSRTCDLTSRLLRVGVGILFALTLFLGVLHILYSDLRVGGVYWFHLDKERNFSTWFSGMLFLLFEIAAITAYYWEERLNRDGAGFRLPILWLGVALVGLWMSLDETTILHENLYWREVRHVSAEFSVSWKYVTQWQVLFAPAILVVLGYFALFFSNRFSLSSGARWNAFSGIGCWVVALLLEGIRGTFKDGGAQWYFYQVLAEEILEMVGAILLMASVAYYTITIAFTSERSRRLSLSSHFLTRKAATAFALVLLALSASGAVIFALASRQASAGSPIPSLFKRALESRVNPSEEGKSDPVPVTDVVKLPGTISSRGTWFGDIKDGIRIDTPQVERLFELIGRSLSRGDSSLGPLPAHLESDKEPRIVFLSTGNRKSDASIAVGADRGFKLAIELALNEMIKMSSDRRLPSGLKLDVVQSVGSPEALRGGRLRAFDRSLEGLVFEGASRVAFLPEELVSHSLVTSKGKVQFKRVNQYLRRRAAVGALSKQLKVRRFSATSFFYDGQRAVPLYRGHRIHGQISKQELLKSAVRGGAYLDRSIGANGRFIYSYEAKRDRVTERYNMVRHAGTVFSMLDLYQTTRDQDLLTGAERAIGHLLESVDDYGEPQDQLSIVASGGKIKLGGVALAVVALAKHVEVTGDTRHLVLSKRLARYIQYSQLETGRFLHQRSYPSGEPRSFVSQYYPGEALLALLRLNALDPDEGWLDTAEKNAHYLINVRDRGRRTKDLIHDHWLLYALNELYRVRPKPLYLKHAFRITEAIIGSQNRTPQFPDYLGSYYTPPRSTPTATRTEGLLAAYQLARDFGSREQEKEIMKAVVLGVSFQLQTQFRPESVIYLKDSERSLGGFHRSLTNFEIRIDYVQHNISALVALYRVLEAKGMELIGEDRGFTFLPDSRSGAELPTSLLDGAGKAKGWAHVRDAVGWEAGVTLSKNLSISYHGA